MYKNIELSCNLSNLLLDKYTISVNNVKENIEYINLACSFDIETTSFYTQDYTKTALMYAFGIGVNGRVYIGRDFNDLRNALQKIKEHYKLSDTRKLIIYVHNLSYEFQFIRKELNIKPNSVFQIDNRKVVKCELLDYNIILKCSYLLSNKSLEWLGNSLHKYKVNKLIGDLDYNIIRHPKTELRSKEIHYLINDNLVVMSYIQELLEDYKNISKIPLTSTGFVRNKVRYNCLGLERNKYKITADIKYYDNLIHRLNILSIKEYKDLRLGAFQGGYTHANKIWVGKELYNVASYDLTSDYPYQLVTKYYPMSTGKRVQINSVNDLEDYCISHCVLMTLTFINLRAKDNLIENYISYSKSYIKGNYSANNGRIVKAEEITITITELDYNIIKLVYDYDNIIIQDNKIRIYERGRLPKLFVKSVLEFYQGKTTLKGIKGQEKEYQHAKEFLNSLYGMCVTDIAKDKLEYDTISNIFTSSKLTQEEIQKTLERYDNSQSRFLSYVWGVWCTAHARATLWLNGILPLGVDYVYTDTDSVKFLNYEKYKNHFNECNKKVIEELKETSEYYKLPIELFIPTTIKGDKKPLGVWDFEGVYTRFKTLGAKRYIYEEDNEVKCTIAGISKSKGSKYLSTFKNPFTAFKEGLYFDINNCGKLTHTYQDNYTEGIITDFNGVGYYYQIKSAVHLEKASYLLTLNKDFNTLIELCNENLKVI